MNHTIQAMLLLHLIPQPQPIGPDDRIPVDRLSLIAALYAMAQRLDLRGVVEATTVALQEELAAPTRGVAA